MRPDLDDLIHDAVRDNEPMEAMMREILSDRLPCGHGFEHQYRHRPACKACDDAAGLPRTEDLPGCAEPYCDCHWNCDEEPPPEGCRNCYCTPAEPRGEGPEVEPTAILTDAQGEPLDASWWEAACPECRTAYTSRSRESVARAASRCCQEER